MIIYSLWRIFLRWTTPEASKKLLLQAKTKVRVEKVGVLPIYPPAGLECGAEGFGLRVW